MLAFLFDISFKAIKTNLWTVFYTAYVITVIGTVILVISQKRDPIKTIAWVLVLVLLPLIGIVLYIYFGQNYRKEKIFSRKGLLDLMHINQLVESQLITLQSGSEVSRQDISANIDIITLLINNSKALLTKKNEIEIYNNGKDAFDEIKESLKNACHHIHLEYYIFNHDKIGNEIKDILIKKANEGVKVRVIYDDVGSWSLSNAFIKKMRKAGIDIKPFMPVKFPFLTNKVNYRNHRKIIIIDGITAFIGGMNIADYYIYGKKDLGPWRDTHLKIKGEAVQSLQAVFSIDWFFVSNQLIAKTDDYFPKVNCTKDLYVQITASGPDSDWASIMQAYFSAIARARKAIHISTPYFIPNESIMTALKTAALSGVDVKIILPGKSDSKMVYLSTLSYVGELLDAGVKVYFYNHGFIHSKLILVDGTFSSVGTANMDNRSFDQNFEVNALIYDKNITEQLDRVFHDDIRKSLQITKEFWENRPKLQNFKESLVRLLSPLF